MSNDVFDSIEILINENFEEIVKCLDSRRENLLSELDSIRLEYKSKLDSDQKTFEELEKMRIQLENIFIQQNQAAQIHESALGQIIRERDAFKATMSETDLKLSLECDIAPILDRISLLGKIVQCEGPAKIWRQSSDDLAPPLPPRATSPRLRSSSLVPVPDTHSQSVANFTSSRSQSLTHNSTLSLPYKPLSPPSLQKKSIPSNRRPRTITSCKPPLPIRSSSYIDKHMPIYSAGVRGNGVGCIDTPQGIAYNPDGEKVYVVNNGSHKVVVFSCDGINEAEFGCEILRKPHSIAIRGLYCCVTDEELNGVVKFQLSTCALIKFQAFNKGGEFGELNGPRGLDIDYEHNVYVVDSINNRICILNADLDFIKVLLDSFLQLPQDIKIIHEMIYVLDRNTEFTVHSFTKCGNLIQSVLKPGKDVFFPSFFTTDFAGQLFVTDADTQGVKVFSLDGDSCSFVGDQTSIWDPSTKGAAGVCVMNDGKVVCAFSEGKYPLCFY